MNELLIDVGNSRLKYAEVTNGQIMRAFAVGHGDGDWRGMFERGLHDLQRPDRLRLAAVAHEMVTQGALATIAKVWPDLRIERITTAQHGGALRTRYADPSRLGVDRMLTSLVAARDLADTVIIGCGTALTADFVDATGLHHGGWIAPGPETMRAAVLASAARVHWLREGKVEDFATNTENALQSGAWHAAAGFAERAMRTAQAQCAGTPRLWVHGGGAEVLAGMLTDHAELKPDLVFLGLQVLP
ncbi:MAG: type III pantothenate kinase [Ahniella sp.]|nr:type III pantothenate kinase [Ahniella sp.]